MKVLIYNFVQPDELGKQGGGVAVYQRNLIQSLSAAGHDVSSMSSGDRYSLAKRGPFTRRDSVQRGSRTVERFFA